MMLLITFLHLVKCQPIHYPHLMEYGACQTAIDRAIVCKGISAATDLSILLILSEAQNHCLNYS